jgi:hypothetical protein
MLILPRQARDRHRENSKKDGVFLQDFFNDAFGFGEKHETHSSSYFPVQNLLPEF